MHVPNHSKNFPTILVLFGITGDLSGRYIIPGIYHLYKKQQLPKLFSVVGFSRRDYNKTDVENLVLEILQNHKDINDPKEKLEKFAKIFSYKKGNFDDEQDYVSLAEYLGRQDNEWKTCANKLFYLAVPPNYYNNIFDHLGSSGLTEPCSEEEGWTRVIVEKPFGHNLETAKALEQKMEKLFKEEQIYRIDHYLGKEMVQNILIFRFTNNLLENSWDNNHIEKLEFKLIENLEVENRAKFYDSVGALRDVGQNHLLQMLALTMMQAPKDFTDTEVRQKRFEILNGLKKMSFEETAKDTIRGQYKGYLDIEEVEENSKTETYFKIKTSSNDPRWRGVPIYIESGKALHKTDKKIVVTFKQKHPCAFCVSKIGDKAFSADFDDPHKNILTFDLDGHDQGITIEFWAKKPGLEMDVEKRVLNFELLEPMNDGTDAEAYEKLILDCVRGDQTLFVSTKEILATWDFTDAIIENWQNSANELIKYEKGVDANNLSNELE